MTPQSYAPTTTCLEKYNVETKPSVLVLKETKALQDESMATLARIRQTTTETKMVGADILEELNDQTKRIDTTAANNLRLEDSLRKAGKQQDRFARWALRFGTRARAKKESKEQYKKDKSAATSVSVGANHAPNFKCRGHRRRKIHTDVETTNTPTRTHCLPNEEQRKETPSNRNELFSNQQRSSSKSSWKIPKPPRTTVPIGGATLSDQDERDLQSIQATDRLLDEGIDALGDEVADLMALSKAIGRTTHQHNAKLEAIDTALEINNAKSKLQNKRLDLLLKRK